MPDARRGRTFLHTQARPLDHGVHDGVSGVPRLAKIRVDAMDGLALGVSIPDFPRCPIINLRTIKPGNDMAALVQGIPAAFHNSAWGCWPPA